MTLQEQLQQAVEEERYEEAASLRDRIAKGEVSLSAGDSVELTADHPFVTITSTGALVYCTDVMDRMRAVQLHELFAPFEQELNDMALSITMKKNRKLRARDISRSLLCVFNTDNMTVEYTFGNRTVLKALLHEGGYTLRA